MYNPGAGVYTRFRETPMDHMQAAQTAPSPEPEATPTAAQSVEQVAVSNEPQQVYPNNIRVLPQRIRLPFGNFGTWMLWVAIILAAAAAIAFALSQADEADDEPVRQRGKRKHRSLPTARRRLDPDEDEDEDEDGDDEEEDDQTQRKPSRARARRSPTVVIHNTPSSAGSAATQPPASGGTSGGNAS